MKRRSEMKKIIILITVLSLLLVAYMGITIVNDNIAESMEQMLCNIPLPPQTEFRDSLNYVGRISGAGNGMEHYAVILLSSSLTEDEIADHYIRYTDEEYSLFVYPQESQYISEYDMWFDCWEAGQACYCVELSKSSIVGCEESLWEAILNLDLRGH